ncbi:hypothetical protein KIH16_12195 [Aminirod propionatiphilus]|uniref:Uncharacterized protein n=1 Tax=Aminirod propionatiphilus TaxID=3415223 RepID=A0ACD1DUS4_9BACT|nr:hypothetical protein KIH16_12195 [Synergistota bacterium]
MRDACALCEGIEEGGKTVDFRFLDVNPAFEALTRGRAPFLLGRTIGEIAPETAPFWIATFNDVIGGQERPSPLPPRPGHRGGPRRDPPGRGDDLRREGRHGLSLPFPGGIRP